MSGRYYKSVGCQENFEIVDFLSFERRKYMNEDNLRKAIDTACESLCKQRTPVRNLQEAKAVRNIGPWVLKHLKEYFDKKQPQMVDEQQSSQEQPSSPEQAPSQNARGKKVRAAKHYCPRKNTAAFALLITLYRAHKKGQEFMKKLPLIEEADMSGLTSQPIMPKAATWNNSGQPNPKDWYSGWNGMKTLINKSLVLKNSNPAKYRLTSEGTALALECLKKAGMQENDLGVDPEWEGNQTTTRAHIQSPAAENVKKTRDVKPKTKNKGHLPCSPDVSNVESAELSRRSAPESARPRPAPPIVRIDTSEERDGRASVSLTQNHRALTTEVTLPNVDDDLAVPPLKLGEKFGDVYDVILILDQRERFRNRAGSSGTHLPQFVEKLASCFKITVEVRQLPVGDGLWIARHKQLEELEYVLDFAFERKQVDDLWSSIKSNRYKQQKQRLLSCGLKRLFYVVEGDVNAIESTEALKTAMVTTELQGGFRVLRTTDTADTSRQYGHLTQAIISRYKNGQGRSSSGVRVCKTYHEFLGHCKELDQDKVKDVFCRMLTQIPQITEDVALSIVDKYPTVISLVQDYEEKENELEAVKVLQGIRIGRSSKTITAGMSRKVFQAFWSQQSNTVLNI